jgi:hypothetical protein
MLLIARNIEWQELPEAVSFFVSQEQVFVTPSVQYSAHAVSVYKNVAFVLIVDDAGEFSFVPSVLFDVFDKEVPKHWVCNLCLGEGVDLVLGPEFIARDLESYNDMVDMRLESVGKLEALVRKGLRSD